LPLFIDLLNLLNMKKIILTTILLILAICCFGQKQHWRYCGYEKWRDTTTKYYSLDGKDSTSYKIVTETCNCSVWIEIGSHKKHLCKGLKRTYIEASNWDWRKKITIVKKDIIKMTPPYWQSSWGSFSLIDGFYTINGKEVQPCILIKEGKTIKINDY
jgi:hypothetical protein